MEITCFFPRNIAGAIRVRAGRDSVEPGLACSLTSRNHVLEDLFCAKTLTMKQKKKKKKDGADDDSEEEDSGEVHEVVHGGVQDGVQEDDGYRSIQRVGVSIQPLWNIACRRVIGQSDFKKSI